MPKKKTPAVEPSKPSYAVSLPDIDAFNAAHHRAQRRLRLVSHILENPVKDFMGEPVLGEPGFISALSELLIDAADDFVQADEVVQRAYKAGRR